MVNYTTLSKQGQADQIYHDRDSLPFSATYPIVEFLPVKIKVYENQKILEKYLIENFWYQKANSEKRKIILQRVAKVNMHIDVILNFFQQTYGHLDKECLHISIAGSYIYSDKPGDIDLNVVIDGSFFDYITFNDGVELLDITGSVRKISLTLMGSDNVSGHKKIVDNIENKGFLHQDTILREMIIAPMRNVTVYGMPFDISKNVDSQNVLVRIARQLYFSTLTLEGKIPYYKDEPLRTKKALNRIKEAHEIIEWLLNSENYR
ncbi:hypothetical protein KA068_01790 [Candidatus Saccharibacteria bacterium]|nr:hypothetical protein [Candidatus Saccharibacteria bacterium]